MIKKVVMVTIPETFTEEQARYQLDRLTTDKKGCVPLLSLRQIDDTNSFILELFCRKDFMTIWLNEFTEEGYSPSEVINNPTDSIQS